MWSGDIQTGKQYDRIADGVVRLDTPFRQRSKAARQRAILQRFAEMRRGPEDVFWLKENAEILNVFEATGFKPDVADLGPYTTFFADVEARLGFFPQYYRFFLSLALDLEDLGLADGTGQRIVEWVAQSGLVDAELSDLQRAEARRLCLRRGVDPIDDDGLSDRLRHFMARAKTFAVPNKKAAYELTHIVFYLSEYGRHDPDICEGAQRSLLNAGTLAFLELNIDLLSEVCIALRFAGETPPVAWERWLRDQVRRFAATADDGMSGHDDYHPWLMLNWFMEVSGQGGFGQEMPEGEVVFSAPKPAAGPLRELSNSILQMGDERSADWTKMRDDVGDALSDEALSVLEIAEQAVDFGAFFRSFARASGPGALRHAGAAL